MEIQGYDVKTQQQEKTTMIVDYKLESGKEGQSVIQVYQNANQERIKLRLAETINVEVADISYITPGNTYPHATE